MALDAAPVGGRRRLPGWAPLAIIWSAWALLQVLWWPLRLPHDWPFAIPLLLFPFDAAMVAPLNHWVPLVTPVVLVALDLFASPRLTLRRAALRYGAVASWMGLSLAIAPSIGVGVVWGGGVSAYELGFITGQNTIAAYLHIMAVALIALGTRWLVARLGPITAAPDPAAQHAHPADSAPREVSSG